MTIEQELFAAYRPNKDKLVEFGFVCFNDVYTFSITFHDGEFEALIVVDEHGVLSGKVIEKEFGDEYFQLRNESFQGGFVGEIREKYKEILLEIRDYCFSKQPFVSNQANRLAILINERYHEHPDYPFDKPQIKDYGVFRYHGNNKWYGLIMNVNKSVFGGENKEEYVDVINVRIDESRRDKILKEKVIYPSYHMNKQKWVSILLDESLSDEEVMEYIDWSRNFMIGKTYRKGNEPLYFIQPCNPKYYDLEAAFIRDNGVTGWKQSRKVNIGDICYMYIANPVGAVKYKCEVVETDIPFEYEGENVSINKLMKIKLLERINGNRIDFKFLKSIGVSLIRGPVSITKEMAKKIDSLITFSTK